MQRIKALELVARELTRAQQKWPPFNTNHEGHSIIEEEFDELWDEIKANRPDYHGYFDSAMQKEATQLAAMALRFLVDRC